MGEKIKDLGKVSVNKSIYTIELNKPVVPGREEQVHFQSDKIRLEMDRSEFVKLASAIYISAERLKKMKGLP